MPPRPTCILIDVDGTVADRAGLRGPHDYKKVHLDKPRMFVINVIRAFLDTYGAREMFLTGRPESCREATFDWLSANVSPPFHLHMRKEKDTRSDDIVKREMYEEIAKHYDVVAVFDDRPKVIRMWREVGLGDRLFDVGNGVEF